MSPLARLFLLTSLATFSFCTALGFYIFLRNRSRKTLSFLLFNLNVALWALGMILIILAGNDVGRIETLVRLTSAFGVLVPANLFFFAASVAGEERARRRGIAVAYLVAFLLSLTAALPGYLTHVSYELLAGGPYEIYIPTTRYGAVFIPTAFFSAFTLFHSLFFLGRKRKQAGGLRRTEIEYVFLGLFVMATLSVSLVLVLPTLGFSWVTPLGPFTIFLMNSVIGYGIARHRILDVSLVISRTFLYALLTLSLGALYIAVILLYTTLFGKIFPDATTAPHLLAAVLVALLVAPLRDRLQSLINRFFVRGRARPEEMLREMSELLAAQKSVPEFLSLLGRRICSFLGVSDTLIATWKHDSGRFSVESTAGEKFSRFDLAEISRDSLFFEELGREAVIVREEWERMPAGARQEETVRVLRSLDAELCVPVVLGGEILALVLVGQKSDRRMFSGSELDLLLALAGQLAMVLKNRELFGQLQRAEKLVAVGTMAAGMAHEIRNPLVSIKTFVQLLPEKFSDPEFRDAFSRIASQEVDRINSIIGELLDLTHPAARENRPVDLPAVIERALFLLSNETAAAGIEVKREFLGPPVVVPGDEASLQRCFFNLLRNAVQAMGKGGLITVTTCFEPAPGMLVARVSDTGEGIAPELLPRIFDFFYTGRADGTGLGLAIAQSIVNDHGGRISVDSRPGRGTVFTVSLPARTPGA